MKLTGKQKRYLRSLAVNIRTSVQIGKAGITNEILTSIRLAGNANELIKINILQNSDVTPEELAEQIGEMGLEVIQIIGRHLVVFKVAEKKDNRKISEVVKNLLKNTKPVKR